MRRYGYTITNKQRWQCVACAITAIRKRPDITQRHWRAWFIRWLIGTATLRTIAAHTKQTTRSIQNQFCSHWRILPQPPQWTTTSFITVLDGTSLLPRQCVVIIAYSISSPSQIAWVFAERETAPAWSRLLAQLPPPRFVICDGQKGLLKALRIHWPTTIVQRCLIHVIRQSIAWITQHPQTEAGQELLSIVRALSLIHTRRQKRRWLHRFRNWCRRHEQFLAAQTRHPNDTRRWWYTHRKLRRVRTLIVRSLPHLFTFVRYPEVPRTSNHVEGGINARLHELFRVHRGLSVSKKCVLTAYFLLSKIEKKSTRKFY